MNKKNETHLRTQSDYHHVIFPANLLFGEEFCYLVFCWYLLLSFLLFLSEPTAVKEITKVLVPEYLANVTELKG